MLELDDVELEFEEEALREIAKRAIERKTGARGLRSIIEGIMLDVMFELPSREDVKNASLRQRRYAGKKHRFSFYTTERSSSTNEKHQRKWKKIDFPNRKSIFLFISLFARRYYAYNTYAGGTP